MQLLNALIIVKIVMWLAVFMTSWPHDLMTSSASRVGWVRSFAASAADIDAAAVTDADAAELLYWMCSFFTI